MSAAGHPERARLTQHRWSGRRAGRLAGAVAISTSPLDYLDQPTAPPSVLARATRTPTPGAADLGELLRASGG